jgi:hypothetical protein
MINLAVRLAVAGGREAVLRLVTIAAAVALGVALLLTTVAGVNGVNSQNARYAWLDSSVGAPEHAATPAGVSPLWWELREDYYAGQPIGRVDLAAAGPDSPVPPGIPRLPGPGEYYASPEMAALLASSPPDQLGDRFPGHLVGTIGDVALPAPNSLIIVIGHTPDELQHRRGAAEVTAIGTVAPSDCGDCAVGIRADAMDLVLSVVAAGLLFPVLIFIGAATRLSAARREQRFASMRLIGATPRQITVIAAIESILASLVGTVIGFGLFVAFRHPLASVPFTGTPFYPSDVSLNFIDVLLVGLGVPLGAAVAARLALRRVHISPLGVTRRVTPKPPRAWGLIPLSLGLYVLYYSVGPHRPQSSMGQVEVYLPSILLVMTGLIVSGPWLTMMVARLLARRSRRPATLIAARRLADNPQTAFRAVSGLVLALFITSVALGIIATVVANRGAPSDASSRGTMTLNIAPDEPSAKLPALPAGLADQLAAVPGVSGALPTHANPNQIDNQFSPGVVLCSDLARTPKLGACPAGAQTAQLSYRFGRPGEDPTTVWVATPVTAAVVAQQPIERVDVVIDGSTATIERTRTILENAYPGSRIPPTTEGDFESDFTKTLTGWKQLANVIILASLPIAGCSLAVSVVGGLAERKRPFALLRLSGAPLRVLRRVVALESAVPLLVVAVVAIAAGLLTAQLFLKAQMQYDLKPLGPQFYVIVAAGILASLGIIASTLPLLARITGPETARND